MEEIQRIPGTQGDTLKAVQNLPGRRARALRHRPAGGVGIVARRHARLRRRRRDPDAVPLRRAALDGQQRDGASRCRSCPAASWPIAGWRWAASSRSPAAQPAQRRLSRLRADGSGRRLADDRGAAEQDGDVGASPSRRSWLDKTLPLLHQQQPAAVARLLRLPGAADVAGEPPRRRRRVPAGLRRQAELVITRDGSRSATAASHIYFHRGILRWTRRLEGGGSWSMISSVGYDVPLQVGVQFGNVPTAHRRPPARLQPARRRSICRCAPGCALLRRRRLRGQPVHARSRRRGAAADGGQPAAPASAASATQDPAASAARPAATRRTP